MRRFALCLLAIAGLLLAAVASSAAGKERKTLLLIGQGPDGHPPTTHEYYAGLKILEKLLAPLADQVDIRQVRADGDWHEGPALVKEADAVVLYLAEGARWMQADARRQQAFAELAERGGGITSLHWALGTRDDRYIDLARELFGGCHGGGDRKYKFLETSVEVATQEGKQRHPITAGIDDFTIKDEFYYQIKFAGGDPAPTPLLQAKIDGELYPVAWAWKRKDGGRSFGFTALHYHENWRRAEYRRFVAQGIAWTLKLEPPRENWPGDVDESDYQLPRP